MINRWRKLLRTTYNTYNTYSIYQSTRNSYAAQRFHSNIVPASNPGESLKESLFLEPDEVPPPPSRLPQPNISVLEEQENLQDVSDIGPPIDFQAFNFAAFVNHSDVLKKFVDLGVDFYTVERKKPQPSYLIHLDLEKDVAPYIQFLLDNGLQLDDLGRYFTKNPYFFMNSLSDLQVRINYLESKKFDRDTITILIRNNPIWLNYSTVEVDRRLGYFQREFKMKGFEIRQMLAKYPQILNLNHEELREKLFAVQDVQEFTLGQCKTMLINVPWVWTVGIEKLKERLEYVLLDMEIPQRLIVADPIILTASRSKIRHRHSFLKSLGRAQYDPKKPNYISPRAISMGDDEHFCREVAKTSIYTQREELYLTGKRRGRQRTYTLHQSKLRPMITGTTC